jgi:hypothetical protein
MGLHCAASGWSCCVNAGAIAAGPARDYRTLAKIQATRGRMIR